MAKLSANYEVIYILNPGLEEEATAALVAKFTDLVTERGGQIASVDEWGKRRLAYPINDLNEGYYVMMTISAVPELPRELDRVFRITENVMRSIIVCKEDQEGA